VVDEDKEPKQEIESEEAAEIAQEAKLQGDPVEQGESVEEPVDQQQRLLAEAEAKAEESTDLYLRTRAEMENLKRRNTRDLANARKFGAEKLAQELLPIADSLQAALDALSGESGAEAAEGLELTLNMLLQALERSGVTVVDPAGEPFDPEQHEALSMLPSAEAEPNTVLAVVQKGYQLNGRLLRPARVVVAKTAD